jgi:hypothetical protein
MADMSASAPPAAETGIFNSGSAELLMSVHELLAPRLLDLLLPGRLQCHWLRGSQACSSGLQSCMQQACQQGYQKTKVELNALGKNTRSLETICAPPYSHAEQRCSYLSQVLLEGTVQTCQRKSKRCSGLPVQEVMYIHRRSPGMSGRSSKRAGNKCLSGVGSCVNTTYRSISGPKGALCYLFAALLRVFETLVGSSCWCWSQLAVMGTQMGSGRAISFSAATGGL